MKDLSFFLHYLIFSIIFCTSLCPHGYLYYTLGYSPVIFIYHQIIPSCTIGSLFSLFLSITLLYRPHGVGITVLTFPYFLSLQDAPRLS